MPLRLPGMIFIALAFSVLCHLVLLFLLAGVDRGSATMTGLPGAVLKATLVDHATVQTVSQLTDKVADAPVETAGGTGASGLVATPSPVQRVGSPWRRSYASRESVYGLMAAPQRQAQQHAEQLLQGRETSHFVKESDAKVHGIKQDECTGNISDQHSACPVQEISDMKTAVKVQMVGDHADNAAGNGKTQ